LAAAKIEEQAGNVYNGARTAAKEIEIGKNEGQAIAEKTKRVLEENDYRPKRAEAVHKEVKDLAKAKDPVDLIDIREKLGPSRDIARAEPRAAAIARNAIDAELDRLMPGTAGKLAVADKNYAIAQSAKRIEEKTRVTQAGSTQLHPTTFTAEAARAARKSYTTPAETAAYQAMRHPGLAMRGARALSSFDPLRHPHLGTLLHLGVGLGTLGLGNLPLAAAGIGARVAYERGLRNRAANISRAIRSQAPASQAQLPRYYPGRPIGPSLGMFTAPGEMNR